MFVHSRMPIYMRSKLLFDSEKHRTSLTVNSGNRIGLIHYDDIVYIMADFKYSKIQLQKGGHFIVIIR